ncbi:MAG TPA: NmrA family NAD(P)-binding protein [Burkholderiales bacterium]|nr:NmrA family NAD(P)-binding protein [Burkholderiales bacterium]
MHSRPLIAVLGATGAQGAGLVRAILADPAQRYAVRAITRSPDGAAAKRLKAEGAEVAYGDLDDGSSLAAAFSGAQGLFALAPDADHASRERQRVLNISTALDLACVRHVVWSAPGGGRTMAGAQAAADAMLAGLPVTFLRPSFFWDNLVRFGMGPRRDTNGALLFVLPMGDRKLPGVAARDVGCCALGVFRRGQSAIGRSIGLSGEHLSGAEMAAELGRVLSEPVRHVSMSFADYAALDFPGAAMLQHWHDSNAECCASWPVEPARELHAGLLSFREWLEATVQHVPMRSTPHEATNGFGRLVTAPSPRR